MYSVGVQAFRYVQSDLMSLNYSLLLHSAAAAFLSRIKPRTLFCLAFSGPFKLTSSPTQNFYSGCGGNDQIPEGGGQKKRECGVRKLNQSTAKRKEKEEEEKVDGELQGYEERETQQRTAAH